MNKIKCGILGATGMVGQRYVSLLENHPWFEVTYLAASPRSAGKKYVDAVNEKWQMSTPIPDSVSDLVVGDANIVESAIDKCDFVFSALELEKDLIKKLEFDYAKSDIPVVSNCSAHRWTKDVPMLLPEVNSSHLDVLSEQKKSRGFEKGFVVVKPNCSIQSYICPMFALEKAGYKIDKAIITTLQASSGAGYPGVPSLGLLDNIIPFIGGEEEKSELEPSKILGRVVGGEIVEDNSIKISAHCNRVPVVDGHTACVSLSFKEKPIMEEIIKAWTNFSSVPQELNLPSAPKKPIIYSTEQDRPQPRKDRDSEGGMAVTIGRLRECKVFDYRFVGLSHNTIRGAAGGGILNAELLKAKNYL
ncbi:MAG: aspartate-semialdehyde dehydrogenase [Candidatus ainarchaeum sp.]|jgi:aspartate-semialdehyde dehydrogenase|nr:aspartate-semialdehyde dehydrogenase [Candidatus ainarchaeum sp.]